MKRKCPCPYCVSDREEAARVPERKRDRVLASKVTEDQSMTKERYEEELAAYCEESSVRRGSLIEAMRGGGT